MRMENNMELTWTPNWRMGRKDFLRWMLLGHVLLVTGFVLLIAPALFDLGILSGITFLGALVCFYYGLKLGWCSHTARARDLGWGSWTGRLLYIFSVVTSPLLVTTTVVSIWMALRKGDHVANPLGEPTVERTGSDGNVGF